VINFSVILWLFDEMMMSVLHKTNELSWTLL